MATLTTVSLQVTRHYNRLSLNGYLYKTETSVKLTPKVLPAHLSKTAAHLVPYQKVFVLERVDCIRYIVMNFTRPLISRFPRYVIGVQTHG